MAKPDILPNDGKDIAKIRKLPRKKITFILILSLLSLFLVFFSLINSKKEKKSEISIKPSQLVEKYTFFPTPTLSLNFDRSLQNTLFHCPSVYSFCEKGEYSETGLSGNVVSGSSIFAVFDGEAEGLLSYNERESTQNNILIVLTNMERGLEAHYFLKSKPFDKKTVKQGDVIAVSTGEQMLFMDNKSFVFELIEFNKNGQERKKLNINDFIK